MNFEFFISRRIRSKDDSSYSRPIIKVAIAGIALGLAVMILAIAILKGFQRQVRDKVVGFSSAVQISNYDSNTSFEPTPVTVNYGEVDKIRQIPGVSSVNPYAIKAGIIRTEEEMHGVVLKGVDTSYNWDFFKSKLVEGTVPVISDTATSNEVIVSRKIVRLLKFKTGDDLRMYFIINSQARGRKFTISGIYNTGMAEFDDMYVIGDIGHIRRLNNWDSLQASGIEVNISDFKDLDRVGEQVYQTAGYNLNTRTMRQMYPQIFDWLEVQDLNVIIILVLLALVSGITMISTLLILVLEHTRDIGTLKALGATDRSIRTIFIYTAINIILYGLLWGNLFGIGLALLQKKFEFIPLPEESYFVSAVPISISPWEILLINLATVAVTTLMMLIPSLVIKYISPVRAIRFD